MPGQTDPFAASPRLSKFLKQPLRVRVVRGVLLAALLAVAAVYTPTPYLLRAPGRAVRVADILTVQSGEARPVHGAFLMTTVLVEKASVLLCVYGILDPDAQLSEDLEVTGDQAQSPGEGQQMELSQYFSTRVALEELGYKVQGRYLGLRILQVDPESPNSSVLRPGDLITEIQGYQQASLDDLRKATKGKAESDSLPAVLQRDGKSIGVSLRLMERQGKMLIGVVLRPEYDAIALPVEVNFRSTNTSGASAGLVFALEIFDQLAPEDLARGRIIAASGTLDGAGRVGGVEGLPFKLVAAERAKAEVFLVPWENRDEIKNAVTRMKIVPVKTFREALDALR